MMLVGLEVRRGDNVLEAGSGTGYNAALLAHLTGPTGVVTTVDIDEKITAGARAGLARTGYDHVHVVAGDGLLGYRKDGPYDRMIITAGATDIAPAWWRQLAQDARMVVPLRWRGLTRAVAFTFTGGVLRSDRVKMCGFVPLIGQDDAREGAIDADGHVRLEWDADQPIEPHRLRESLACEPVHHWTGVTVRRDNESFDGVWLRLTATEPGTCRITADSTAIETGLCDPGVRSGPAIVEGASFAYFTYRLTDQRAELGAVGHGPHGPDFAERLAAQIHAWDQDRTLVPTITAYPAGTLDHQLADGTVLNKPATRLVITYPMA
ncbi:methyltransferase, FxLD system [Cryptosporangium phraense]|uniref:methyltransferase, FxLD system n=1 Tax=Cryptosporangium phraense TaxID=2593070 RepID=UPI001F0F4209|nr:methyltransferase, FxLD system [Cryptosporangium phraense]